MREKPDPLRARMDSLLRKKSRKPIQKQIQSALTNDRRVPKKQLTRNQINGFRAIRSSAKLSGAKLFVMWLIPGVPPPGPFG